MPPLLASRRFQPGEGPSRTLIEIGDFSNDNKTSHNLREGSFEALPATAQWQTVRQCSSEAPVAKPGFSYSAPI